ncbi:unnamed protein product, partial [Discosporangium mesarthrocarpum]
MEVTGATAAAELLQKGEEMLGILQSRLGEVFLFEAEYTHVQVGKGEMGAGSRAPVAAAAAAAAAQEVVVKAEGEGEGKDGPAAAEGAGERDQGPTAGGPVAGIGPRAKPGLQVQRVVNRIKAVKAGQFVVYVGFDAPAKMWRPTGVSV